MSIPHVDRSLAHIDRTTIDASPAVAFEGLLDLANLLEGRDDVRVDAWPAGGLQEVGASFWAVHQAVPAAGHAVSYEVVDLQSPNLLDLAATSDLYDASHRVQVAPGRDGGTELSWTVVMVPDQATTHQLLEDASLLATVTLHELEAAVPALSTPADRAATVAPPA